MKNLLIKSSQLLIILFLIPVFNIAQSTDKLISEIQELMLEHYIFLDKAKEVNAHLDQKLKAKYFDAFKTPEELARAIRTEMQSLTQDKHLRVYPPRIPVNQSQTEGLPLRVFSRYNSPMINEVKYFEQNVGYMDMRYFGGGEQNWAKIDAAMKQLAQADAIIFDMRKNGGGSIATVQYFCSYFFDKYMLLNSIYSREDDHLEELWTKEVNGRKRPKVPIFILTSARTFSGAEDFSYTLQNHGRATIIGEVTRGGAHPTRSHTLSNQFRVSIPFAKSIHPVTKSNWEGIGVIPDIKIKKEGALDKALELASKAANDYKNIFIKPLETILLKPKEQLITEAEYNQLHNTLTEMVSLQMINESDLNRFGYRFLASNRENAALAIFKINTELFPQSANVFDSYAEALATQGVNDLALENYKKAVSIATKNNLPELSDYQENLKQFQEKNK